MFLRLFCECHVILPASTPCRNFSNLCVSEIISNVLLIRGYGWIFEGFFSWKFHKFVPNPYQHLLWNGISDTSWHSISDAERHSISDAGWHGIIDAMPISMALVMLVNKASVMLVNMASLVSTQEVFPVVDQVCIDMCRYRDKLGTSSTFNIWQKNKIIKVEFLFFYKRNCCLQQN